MIERSKVISKRYEYLEQFVDLANLLTPGREWPTPDDLAQLAVRVSRQDENAVELDQQRLAIIGPIWEEAARRFRPKAEDRLELFGDLGTLHGNVVVFRRPSDDPTRRLFTFVVPELLYEAAYNVRTTLRLIARSSTPVRQVRQRRDRKDSRLVVAATRQRPLDLALPATPMSVQIQPNGAITVGLDLYRDCVLDALASFDARLIRECSACGRLFIAKRSDQPTCSPACANRERQRRFRPDHPGYHKRDQRAVRSSTLRKPFDQLIEDPEFLWQQEA